MQRRVRDPRRRFWKRKDITQDIHRHYGGRTLDVYDVWMLLNILDSGKMYKGLRVERDDEKIHFMHDLHSSAIYDAKDRALTIRYGPVGYYSLTINDVEIKVPQGLHELKVEGREEWLITKRMIVNWSYAPFFKPQIHLEGVTWADEAIKAWIQRWEDGFAYVAILGVAPRSLNIFYEEEAYIAQGAFRGGTIHLVQSYDHSPKIVPHRVVEFLRLERR